MVVDNKNPNWHHMWQENKNVTHKWVKSQETKLSLFIDLSIELFMNSMKQTIFNFHLKTKGECQETTILGSSSNA
jgi:hypothetical protein